MPQPIMKKYKQGELGKPYSKEKNKSMKYLDLSIHANRETRPDTFPTKPNTHVQSSFWKKASEKDY